MSKFIIVRPDGNKSKPVSKKSVIEAFKSGKLSDECRVYPEGSESFLMIEEFVLSAADDRAKSEANPGDVEGVPESPLPPVVLQVLPVPVPIDQIAGSPKSVATRRRWILSVSLLSIVVVAVASLAAGTWVIKKRNADRQAAIGLMSALILQQCVLVVDPAVPNEERSAALGSVVEHFVESTGLNMDFGQHAVKFTDAGMPSSCDFESGVCYICTSSDDRVEVTLHFTDSSFVNDENREKILALRLLNCFIAERLFYAKHRIQVESYGDVIDGLDFRADRNLTRRGEGWDGYMVCDKSRLSIEYSIK